MNLDYGDDSSSGGGRKESLTSWRKLSLDDDNFVDLQPRDLRDRSRPQTYGRREIRQRAEARELHDYYPAKRNEDMQHLRTIAELVFPANEIYKQHRYLPGIDDPIEPPLLTSNIFQEWVEGSGRTLYCTGNPGTGKNTLTRLVLNTLRAQHPNPADVGLTCLFGDFGLQRSQTARDLLFVLLFRLLEHVPSWPEGASEILTPIGKARSKPTIDQLKKAVCAAVAGNKKVFLLVNALDECHISAHEREMFISALLSIQETSKANLFVTSRPDLEMQRAFGDCIFTEVKATEQELETVLKRAVAKERLYTIMIPARFRPTFFDKIIKASDGMFCPVYLYLMSLENKRSVKAVKMALESLPKGLESYDILYRATMERIRANVPEVRDLAIQALAWITFAQRPLTMVELAHALAIEPGILRLTYEDLPDIDDLDSLCVGLVITELEGGTKVARLAHYTVYEFLSRTADEWFPDAHANLAKNCMTYLSFDVFEQHSAQDVHVGSLLSTNLLLGYAGRYWGHHARLAKAEPKEAILELLSNQNRCSVMLQVATSDFRTYYDEWDEPNVQASHVSGHLAAIFGLQNTMCSLRDSGHDLDAPDYCGNTPLLHAVNFGHESLVKWMLSCDNIDPEPEFVAHPLVAAIKTGNESIIQTVLDHPRVTPTPLTYLTAANCDNELLLDTLFKHDRHHVEVENSYGQTALLCAAYYGSVQAIEYLLKRGNVDVKAIDQRGRNSLALAARRGHLEVVQMLLKAEGIDLNSQDKTQSTPLLSAVSSFKNAVAVALIEYEGVELDIPDVDGRTPLLLAMQTKQKDIAALLLKTGNVDMNRADKSGFTPLFHAVARNAVKSVELLIEAGADLDRTTRTDLRTPLHCAIMWRRREIAQLLISSGKVDLNKLDIYEHTPLWFAAVVNEKAVVELLLEQEGVDIDAKDTLGRTPLAVAIRKNCISVATLLLGKHKEQGRDIANTAVQLIGMKEAEAEHGCGVRCDVCWSKITEEQLHHHCDECSEGEVDICKECFGLGARCFDSRHTLIEQKIIGNDFVEVLDPSLDSNIDQEPRVRPVYAMCGRC